MKLRLAAALGLLLMMTAPLVLAADPIEMPKDLQELLPADPAILLTCSSIEELDANWKEIAEVLAEDEDEGEIPDLMDWMREELGEEVENVDTTRPMAVAFDMGPLLMGMEPYFTWVFPVKDGSDGWAELSEDDDETSTVIQGDYVAFHSTTGYVPGGALPDIASDMVPGVVNAVIDLEGLLLTYRPFVEMGLAAIPVGIATTDTLENGEVVVTEEGMTQEEADALVGMVRALMDSCDRFDMGVGAADGMIRFDMRFATLPDSPLAPGPQPDFDEALALSGLLPPGGDFLMAYAMDMSSQMDIFKDFYILNARREGEKMGNEGYALWFESYLGLLDLWSNPMAASYGMSEDGMVFHAAMTTPDAAGDAERVVGVIEGLAEIGMGMELTPLPTVDVGGTQVRSWKIDFDPEFMSQFEGAPAESGLTGAGQMQAEQFTTMMKKMVPGLSLAAKGDYLLLSADGDPGAMAGMIEAADKGRAEPVEALVEVAEAEGPRVQEAVTGDLSAFLEWFIGIMEDVGEEDVPAIGNDPIPFDGWYTMDGVDLGFGMSMEMAGFKNLVNTLNAMDLDEEMKNYSDENEEEFEEKMEEVDEG